MEFTKRSDSSIFRAPDSIATIGYYRLLSGFEWAKTNRSSSSELHMDGTDTKKSLWCKIRGNCWPWKCTNLQGSSNEITSVICNTESGVPCIEFVSSSLSTWCGWPTWTYVDAVLPRNAFTVRGCPRILRRNAVRHLESMFSLIRCQSRSVMANRWTRWPMIHCRSCSWSYDEKHQGSCEKLASQNIATEDTFLTFSSTAPHLRVSRVYLDHLAKQSMIVTSSTGDSDHLLPILWPRVWFMAPQWFSYTLACIYWRNYNACRAFVVIWSQSNADRGKPYICAYTSLNLE